MAIDAVTFLNRERHQVDLVLIGPDDDGRAVTPHTFYYGPQPRDVVLGALSSAVCLVNMSESFGIVLLESWLSGRPAIALRKCMAFADPGCLGENGFCAESPSEIAVAIECYLAHPDLAQQHGAHGKAIAQAYSRGALAERIESALLDAAFYTN